MPPTSSRRLRAFAVRVLLLLLLSLLPFHARAAGTVTNCTEAALLTALDTGGEVTIACDGVITIAATIVISADTTLQGSGRSTSINGPGGTNGVRLFLVQPGVKFTVKNLSLANGQVASATGGLAQDGERAAGGAILNQGGSVTLLSVTLSGNSVTGGDGGSGLGGAGSGNGEQGGAGGAGLGGAIYNEGGSILASNVVFISSSTLGGRGGEGGPGGIGGNGGHGGDGGAGGVGAGAAIYNGLNGRLTVIDCTFASNRVSGASAGLGGLDGGGLGFPGENGFPGWGMGAAIFNDGGDVSITGSTFTQNSAEGAPGEDASAGVTFERHGDEGTPGGSATGGGIFNNGGNVLVTNCTFVANNLVGGSGGNGGAGSPIGFGGDGGDGGSGGDAIGGGIATGPSGNTTVVNCTFAQNTLSAGEGGAGGAPGTAVARSGSQGRSGGSIGSALYSQGGPIAVRNSILAGTRDSVDVGGNVADAGFNLVSDASLSPTASGTRLNTDALLTSLANNGALTSTVAISSNSPALNAVTLENGCPPTDQRHAPRSGFCDIGAFEFGATAPGVALAAQLRVNSPSNNIVLSWPPGPSTVVETTETLAANWVTLASTPVITNDVNVLTVPATNRQRFFRLRQQ